MTKGEKKILGHVIAALKLAQENLKRVDTDPNDQVVRLCKDNVKGELKHALRLLEILSEEE